MHVCVAALQSPSFAKEAADLQTWLKTTFNTLHQIPELSFGEQETSFLIQQKLQQLDVRYQAPIAKTGVLATLGFGQPTVFFRADIDGLPISEDVSHELR